uniref:Uncharacterized protein n=1 Tax=Tanacetum cinerariifolium TaxID=118510 RepID=A0A6L2ML87_TANCI|nr:hypothetical protein [Tanacetum cinerariifolium]
MKRSQKEMGPSLGNHEKRKAELEPKRIEMLKMEIGDDIVVMRPPPNPSPLWNAKFFSALDYIEKIDNVTDMCGRKGVNMMKKMLGIRLNVIQCL